MEGLSYEDQSPYWYKQDDAIQPNSTFIYMWTINSKSGPQNNESDCRTWTYYSAVNPVSMNVPSYSFKEQALNPRLLQGGYPFNKCTI